MTNKQVVGTHSEIEREHSRGPESALSGCLFLGCRQMSEMVSWERCVPTRLGRGLALQNSARLQPVCPALFLLWPQP